MQDNEEKIPISQVNEQNGNSVEEKITLQKPEDRPTERVSFNVYKAYEDLVRYAFAERNNHFEMQVSRLCQTMGLINNKEAQQTLLDAINQVLNSQLKLVDFLYGSDELKKAIYTTYKEELPDVVETLLIEASNRINDNTLLELYRRSAPVMPLGPSFTMGDISDGVKSFMESLSSPPTDHSEMIKKFVDILQLPSLGCWIKFVQEDQFDDILTLIDKEKYPGLLNLPQKFKNKLIKYALHNIDLVLENGVHVASFLKLLKIVMNLERIGAQIDPHQLQDIINTPIAFDESSDFYPPGAEHSAPKISIVDGQKKYSAAISDYKPYHMKIKLRSLYKLKETHQEFTLLALKILSKFLAKLEYAQIPQTDIKDEVYFALIKFSHGQIPQIVLAEINSRENQQPDAKANINIPNSTDPLLRKINFIDIIQQQAEEQNPGLLNNTPREAINQPMVTASPPYPLLQECPVPYQSLLPVISSELPQQVILPQASLPQPAEQPSPSQQTISNTIPWPYLGGIVGGALVALIMLCSGGAPLPLFGYFGLETIISGTIPSAIINIIAGVIAGSGVEVGSRISYHYIEGYISTFYTNDTQPVPDLDSPSPSQSQARSPVSVSSPRIGSNQSSPSNQQARS
jgi:hypothetical protein